MGVKNLWDILESCKKTLPLHHLQNKRLCIDLSCWIVQLHSVCKTQSGLKDKVYLSNLFHRLRALIALNCSLIFVTDGSIPAIKLSTYRRRLGSGSEATRDETNSNKQSLPRNMGSEFSCMIKEAKDLGLALGIPCLDGIEEGEAQCALLNSESLCDGCFTADSDIFLFGAKTVYRDIDLGDGGHVVCYEMVDIERKLGFGRNSLITLALLLGSDYSQGVRGFGPETACKIVKSFGDHTILQQVASEGLAFAKKTKGMKKQGETRNCNANKENSNALNDRSTVNERDSQKDELFLKVIDAYMQPKCHSPDSDVVHRVLGQYPLKRTELQRFCFKSFGWTSEKTDDYILPKVAERDLRRFSNLRSQSSELGVHIPLHEIPVECPVSAIIKHRKMQGKECFEVEWSESVGIKSSIVPADLIERACPEKIVEFEEKLREKKNNRKPKSKKTEKTAAMEELDLKLQNLMLDIESESNGACCSARSLGSILREKVGTKQIDTEKQIVVTSPPRAPEVIDIPSPGWSPEVINIPSASPLIRAHKTSNFQNLGGCHIDTIHLSDSETEMSPEHSRNAREFTLFSASIDTASDIL